MFQTSNVWKKGVHFSAELLFHKLLPKVLERLEFLTLIPKFSPS